MTPEPGVPSCHNVFLLAGPTASGKSEVALLLAEFSGAEIVSVDSMQVYRGLDIGTAKPGAADRSRVPHHLLDVVGPDEPFDAARWLEAARAVVAEIQRRRRPVILCGGTGLYFSAWLGRLDPLPASDPHLRAELEALPLDILLSELADRDPETFASIDRRNPRRVVRAVELLRLTGKPLGRRRAPLQAPVGVRVHVLQREPADLRRRIEARVDAMFDRGWVEEVRALAGSGLGASRSPLQAIGYRQILEHLRGERDLASTVALIKTRTWQFARRQMTWFRNQLPVQWLDVGPEESPDRIADRLRVILAAEGWPLMR
ncbi:MAG: tRNA (adenosine(37)-N6)-dimethylallyltransferase MiaA [Verrucomicrobiales bacterium]|nr:tRNA (adenosine(37)-N6)-dimethylallyltransferase MiaA [Verrucomicrobiales bacterium]